MRAVSHATGTIAARRGILAREGYDARRVAELVHPDQLDAARAVSAFHLRPAANEPLGRLVRLFFACEEVDAAAAAEALAPIGLTELEHAGVVERTQGMVRSLLRLTPLRDVLVASDPWRPGRLGTDHVVAPGQASETLAKLTIRSPVRSALDLCAGSGVQALLAASALSSWSLTRRLSFRRSAS